MTDYAWANLPPESTSFEFVPLDERFEWSGDLVIIDAPGLDVGQGWLRGAIDDALRPGGEEPRYSMEYRRNTTEWGASADMASVAVQLAGDVFVSVAAGSLPLLARKLAQQIRDGKDARVLTEEEAVDSARYRIAMKYDVAVEDLELVSVEQDAEAFTLVLRDVTGFPRYEVAVALAGGLVTFICIKRVVAE